MIDYFISIDEKQFRANQVFQWIHQKGITSFEKMHNLSNELRRKLDTATEIIIPKIKLSP